MDKSNLIFNITNISLKNFNVPKKVSFNSLEKKIGKYWDKNKVYCFKKNNKSTKPIYAIDTPPPTISGLLHMGHVFSYTQVDVFARYHRMLGKSVFYTVGWDNNGIPTENRVYNFLKINSFQNLIFTKNLQNKNSSYKEKIKLKHKLYKIHTQITNQDGQEFENLFKLLGISFDWSMQYRTNDSKSRKISQKFFIKNLKSNHIYQQYSPNLWDLTFKTVISQAETELRKIEEYFYYIKFKIINSAQEVIVSTTRPELLPSCVGLVVNPNDERYKNFINKKVQVPIFGLEVVIYSHNLVKLDKGSGVTMISTFGDSNDIIWYREFNLPIHSIIDKHGMIINQNPKWLSSKELPKYKYIIGKTIKEARQIIINLLTENKFFSKKPKKNIHKVAFYEKGKKPLEIIVSKQWYIKNGTYDINLRNNLIKKGKKVNFVPKFMRLRYEHWIKNLKEDWVISRQRMFGIPIPLWYSIDSSGLIEYSNPILPKLCDLPVDPSVDTPNGFEEGQRNLPNGFKEETSVLDTWATSSLTPQINKYLILKYIKQQISSFDLRAQSHDIIRTWFFLTMLRAEILNHPIPWKNSIISGWALSTDNKKLSKSKNNNNNNHLNPMSLINEYGADALRYWAVSARLGFDTICDINKIKIGRRLSIKLMNISKFIFNICKYEDENISILNLNYIDSAINERYIIDNDIQYKYYLNNNQNCNFINYKSEYEFIKINNDRFHILDICLLDQLIKIIKQSNNYLKKYDPFKTMQVLESFLWSYSDNYIELIKHRVYDKVDSLSDKKNNNLLYRKLLKRSSILTLITSLNYLLKAFSIFLPFTTEEIWSWWRLGSIHNTNFPLLDITIKNKIHILFFKIFYKILEEIRKIKTQLCLSQKANIKKIIIYTTPKYKEIIKNFMLYDIKFCTNVKKISFSLLNIKSSKDILIVKNHCS